MWGWLIDRFIFILIFIIISTLLTSTFL